MKEVQLAAECGMASMVQLVPSKSRYVTLVVVLTRLRQVVQNFLALRAGLGRVGVSGVVLPLGGCWGEH